MPEKIKSQTKQQIELKFILSGAQGPEDEDHSALNKATALKGIRQPLREVLSQGGQSYSVLQRQLLLSLALIFWFWLPPVHVLYEL